MPQPKLGLITLQDRRILFRNFSGKKTQYNAEGARNFNVLLEDREAEEMLKDGWNVKYLQPREEGDQPQPRLEVSIRFEDRPPPRIILITSRGKTSLDESMVDLLDWADIVNVDLIIRPYQWEINEKTGIKAYLKSIYVTIREDELELKYVDIPDSAAVAIVMTEEEKDPF